MRIEIKFGFDKNYTWVPVRKTVLDNVGAWKRPYVNVMLMFVMLWRQLLSDVQRLSFHFLCLELGIYARFSVSRPKLGTGL